MYYFGTNLESRFAVPDFWPSQDQSHKIPYEKEEIRAEIERHQRNMRNVKEMREKEGREALQRAKVAFGQGAQRANMDERQEGGGAKEVV